MNAVVAAPPGRPFSEQRREQIMKLLDETVSCDGWVHE
jgi:hypothetical protein